MTFDHALVMVSDLERSLPWYAAVLGAIGFRKSRDHVWLNEAEQAIDLRQAEDDRPYLRRGVGLNHMAFRAGGHAEVERVAAEVAAAGFEAPEIQHFGADRALFLMDPDGMRIEVISYA